MNTGAEREPDAGREAEAMCPACGASQRRTEARFCATCGRELRGGADYFPLDSLRASYHLQDRRGGGRVSQLVARASRPVVASSPHPRAMPLDRNSNGAATTALAFVTYSLVPYLGILFCPGALVMGGVGLLRAQRAPHVGGRRAAATSIVLGVVVFGAQIFLWWILYKIPEWTR
ncbi:MAG TPA: hypothetical protein VF240_06460 [Pyrinomonadaceae bacterium]